MFYGCSKLRNIKIPDNVTNIEFLAFSNCIKLETVYLSSSIENIGEEAFSGCNNLMEIKNGSKKVINCNENVFADVAYDNATFYVPKGRKIFYERKSPWNKFIIEEFDDVDTFV